MASGPELSDLQKLELKEAFDEFDKVIQMTSKLYNNQFQTSLYSVSSYFLTFFKQDGSGTITTKELLPVLRSIGQNPSEDEILSLVIEYDVNGDGTIDFDEFVEVFNYL